MSKFLFLICFFGISSFLVASEVNVNTDLGANVKPYAGKILVIEDVS